MIMTIAHVFDEDNELSTFDPAALAWRRTEAPMTELLQDVKYAARRLSRTPGFTLLALATLALGIGANAALFSVVDAVLLRPLPFSRPEGLVAIWSRHTSTDRYPFSLPEFCDYRDRNQSLQAVAGLAGWTGSLVGEETTERLSGMRVSGNLFEMLGVSAALGRALRPSDDDPGSEKVVVLSHGLWQRRFGSDPGIAGRPLILNGEAYVVVGVLPREFLFPVPDIDLAIPLSPEQDPLRHNRGSTNFLRILARVREGSTPAAVTTDLEEIGRGLQEEFPGTYARKKGVLVTPYREELTRSFSRTLGILMAAVALLLLVACANLANLMLVRATGRRTEMATRQALGARPARLARELLVESALLSVAGAVLGVGLASWAVPALVAASPTAMPRSQAIALNGSVLAFTAIVAVAAGLGFGLAPAWRALRFAPKGDLQSSRGGTGTRGESRARGVIVGAQVAAMVVLLSGASLLYQSFHAVTRIEPGFDTEVLTVRLSLPRKDYADNRKISLFYQELEARLRELPGVESVAAANQIPLNGAIASADYKVADGPPVKEDELPTALYRMVTPHYFRTLRIPLVAGRGFDDRDRLGQPAVGIVSESLARQSFPGRDPVGRQLLVKDTPEGFRSIEIVGVTGDVRHGSLEAPPEPHLYVSYHQVPPSLLGFLAQTQFVVARAEGDALSLGEEVKRAVHALDPNVASAGARLSGSYLEAASAARRFSVVLIGAFAGIALVLAAVGIYAVVSYTVAQRTRETGLRLALGAGAPDILTLVLGEGLKRSAWGLVAGLVAAVAAARGFQSLLFGVEASDLATYAGVALLLLAVTVGASIVPAWWAARLDPVRALRQD
jgi:predicted permease